MNVGATQGGGKARQREGTHLERPRVQALLEQASRYSVVTVCAMAGYGKTRAVRDFAQKSKDTVIWFGFSESDNDVARFWESYTAAVAQANEGFAGALREAGFPESDKGLADYLGARGRWRRGKRIVTVLDDLHLVENPKVIAFLERGELGDVADGTLFLISRADTRANLVDLFARDAVFSISEKDLRFTDQEVAWLGQQQGLSLPSQSVHRILADTEGWPFAVNLFVVSLKREPDFKRRAQSAIKLGIFRMMEHDAYSKASDGLRRLLVKLSLVERLPAELVESLAGDPKLVEELRRANAYIRYDEYIHGYRIHRLFAELLREKQDILSEEEKLAAWELAGEWSIRNGYDMDAIALFRKAKDYGQLLTIAYEMVYGQAPADFANFILEIFDGIPEETRRAFPMFPLCHLRLVMSLNRMEEFERLFVFYERECLALPESPLRSRVLSSIYGLKGFARAMQSCFDERYDFDECFALQDDYYREAPFEVSASARNMPVGSWVSLAGKNSAGSVEGFAKAIGRAAPFASDARDGCMHGMDDLAAGELLFYQGDVKGAERLLYQGLEKARGRRQYNIYARALFYIMRIRFLQGDFAKIEDTLREMEGMLDESEYMNRFHFCDFMKSWYHISLRQPQLTADWLKAGFAQALHPGFIDHLGDFVLARYLYASKEYGVLLAYAETQRGRPEIVFGRMELLALEAVAHYQVKDRRMALTRLAEAYEFSLPNGIVMPLIEAGKDMRTLTAAALKEGGCPIPREWLEGIGHKAASYAKRQSHLVTEYRIANHIVNDISLSRREAEVLNDLSHGLARTEIAASRQLSVNTVKLLINSLYDKFGAGGLADLIRIATDRRMI